MNKEILYLFKVHLINQYRLNSLKKGSMGKSDRHSLMVIIGFGSLALVFGGYSFALAYGLGYAGLSGLIPAYAVTVTGIPTLTFTMLKANGFLFGYRDYDLLMSLPVSTQSVIASRFLTVYFTNMLFTLVLMGPMGAGYVLWVRPGILFYLYWLIGMITAPLIPTTVAVILGALVMALASRFKYAKVFSTLLTLLLVIGSVLLSMSGGTIGQNMESMDNMIRLGEVIYQEICRFYPPAGLFAGIFEENGFSSLLLFAGSSLGIYALFLWLLSLKYKSINTGLIGQIKRADYRLSTLNTASPLKALYRKELKRFFTSTPYVSNVGAGILMAFLFAAGLTVLGPAKMEESLGMPGFTSSMNKILPFLLSALLGMSCSTGSSLSLEGKNLWLLQSGPLPLKTIFDSKILVNLTLTVPISIISGLLLVFRLQLHPANALLLFVVPVTCSFFSAVWGMFMNIRMPRYDWESEMSVVKRSAASMAGMMGSALIILIAMGLSFLPLGVDYRLLSFLVMILMWCACFFLYRSICRTHKL